MLACNCSSEALGIAMHHCLHVTTGMWWIATRDRTKKKVKSLDDIMSEIKTREFKIFVCLCGCVYSCTHVRVFICKSPRNFFVFFFSGNVMWGNGITYHFSINYSLKKGYDIFLEYFKYYVRSFAILQYINLHMISALCRSFHQEISIHLLV